MSLLRQDVRLPESSVHDFGRDLVVALQVRANESRQTLDVYKRLNCKSNVLKCAFGKNLVV